MWESLREWGLAALALLGAIFAPISYVMSLRTEIKVLEAKIDGLEKRQSAIESWLIRVEGKLDKVLVYNK